MSTDKNKYLTFSHCKLSEPLPIFTGCDICGNSSGKIYIKNEENNITSATTCECLLEWQRIKRVQRILKKANVPVRFWDYQISSYPEKLGIKNILLYISNYKLMLEKGFNLYLQGGNTTGKTCLGSYILKIFAYLGYTISYINFRDIITYIEKNRFKFQEGSKSIEQMFETDILFIDDIPKDGYTDSFVMDLLTVYLKYRLGKKEVTIYSSKFSATELNLHSEFMEVLTNRTKEVTLFSQFNTNIEIDNYFD